MNKWLKILGYILIFQSINFGYKILIGIFSGSLKLFVANLGYMALDFVELFVSPVGWLRLILLGLGIWLVCRKMKT
jgi:hypothetical protein